METGGGSLGIGQFTASDLKAPITERNINDSLRIYQALRPDAPPFYEEDAMLRMQADLNKQVIGALDIDADSLDNAG